jgi:GTP-binding protein
MKLTGFEFFGSFSDLKSLPRGGRPEIAFWGRSNVGKSSIINALLGTRGGAFTSKTPGRTGNANYFLVNERFFFVDMPGYGYAKVPKDERMRWRKLEDDLLFRTRKPEGVVLIMDVRRSPSKEDRETILKLGEAGKRMCFVFNKIDKLRKDSLGRKITENLEGLHVEGNVGLIPFSCITGEGKGELWAWISDTLAL